MLYTPCQRAGIDFGLTVKIAVVPDQLACGGKFLENTVPFADLRVTLRAELFERVGL